MYSFYMWTNNDISSRFSVDSWLWSIVFTNVCWFLINKINGLLSLDRAIWLFNLHSSTSFVANSYDVLVRWCSTERWWCVINSDIKWSMHLCRIGTFISLNNIVPMLEVLLFIKIAKQCHLNEYIKRLCYDVDATAWTS